MAISGLNLTQPKNIEVVVPQGTAQAKVFYDAPTALSTCTNASTTVMKISGISSGGLFPAGLSTVHYRATDNCGNVKTVTFTVNVKVANTGPDCSLTKVTVLPGTLKIDNLYAPNVNVQVFNSAWQPVFTCTNNCNTPQIIVPNLPSGKYNVKIKFLTQNWGTICSKSDFYDVPAVPLPELTVGKPVVSENVGAVVLSFALSRTANQNVSVNYTTANGTAIAPQDYLSTAGTLTIPAGATSAMLTIPIANDAVKENMEDFFVILTSIAGATIDCSNACTCDDPSAIADCTYGCHCGPTCTCEHTSGSVKIIINDDDQTSTISCDNITTSTNNNSITVNGLLSPISGVQVYKVPAYTPVFNCFGGNCATNGKVVIPNLEPGNYEVKTKLYNAQGQFICKKNELVTISNTTPLSPCDAVTAEVVNGNNLIVRGLNAPNLHVQVFREPSYAAVFSCLTGFCAVPNLTIPNLGAGNYKVKVSFYSATWSSLCTKELNITINSVPTPLLTLTCPPTKTIVLASGQTAANVQYTSASATTTCPIGTPTVAQSSGLSSGASFPIGTHAIVYTASDACGNEKTCSFNIVMQSGTTPYDCNSITFASAAQSIVVGNLPSNIVTITVYKLPTYQKVFECLNNCTKPTVTIPGLAAGSYQVKVNVYNEALSGGWIALCSKKQDITVSSQQLVSAQNAIIFDAQKQGDDVLLQWIDRGDAHHAQYIVERSADGILFEPISTFVANGVQGEIKQMQHIDSEPLQKNNYYRIKLTLYDGSEIVSETRRIIFANEVISIYPNPAVHTFTVVFDKTDEAADIEIYSMKGERVYKKQFLKDDMGAAKIQVNGWEAGIYILKINCEGQRDMEKQFEIVAD